VLGVSQPFLSQIRAGKRPLSEALRLANEGVQAAGKTVGRWLEEAIQEKSERESNND